ncbi:MAG: hypothetical protein JSS90_08565 [Bacteroidetes bacterium]|jgi:hypothetical protein|nr:hypothetical protein [Bacteroidota bacterium]
MKYKVLNLLLILTSLIGYLQWSGNNSAFLFEAEYEVINKLFSASKSVIHPFTVIPLLGQLLLFITLFQKRPGKILTYTGIACLGLLLGLMFIIGLMEMNLKILISTLPFLSTAGITLKNISSK